MKPIVVLIALLIAVPVAALVPVPAAVTHDPAPDAANPAGNDAVQFVSHGSSMNALVYTPSGKGPHPALLLLHGFPGNEQNLDLAQAARRQGWVVLTLHYRGSWGSKGDFSFSHVLDDAQVALDWLRAPAQVAKYHLDPARLVIAGHSMGGFAAAKTGAANPAVHGVLLIDAWNPGLEAKMQPDTPAARAAVLADFAENVPPLSGTSPQALADEIAANRDRFDLRGDAPALATRPILLISASQALGAENEQLAARLKAAGGAAIDSRVWNTDHAFSGMRIALITASLQWLAQFQGGN